MRRETPEIIPLFKERNVHLPLRGGNLQQSIVGRLVVVIDVNPSHGFWTTRLMKLFGHEGK
jgi:hypothetical protein